MSTVKFAQALFLTISFVWLLTACTESECTSLTDPRLNLRFVIQIQKRNTSGVLYTQTKDTTIRLVSVTGIGNTSGKYVSQVGSSVATINSLSAYLSKVDTTTAFVIEWDTAKLESNRGKNSIFKDTLSVRYQKQPYFVSEGCGFNYEFRNISIAKETFTKSKSKQIRSVTLTNPVADEGLPTNITILFNRRTR